MSKVLVYGWYNKRNCGDESYKLSFPRLFAEHELTFTDRLDRDLIESHDGVILGGGNILDIHHVGRVNKFAALLKDKPLYAFSVGFTDAQVQSSQLSVFKHIYVRDMTALRRLQGMGIQASFCPDAAFALEPSAARGKKIWKSYFEGQGHDLYEKRVVIVCNSHLISGGGEMIHRNAMRFQVVTNDLATLMDQTNASFMLVPFGCSSPWDDRIANSWVGGQCKWYRKNVVVYDQLEVQETLDVIAAANAVVSMRYHSSVFAALAGVPFLDICHHDKNESFLKTLGLESWGIPYWDFSREQARAILGGHLLGLGGDRVAQTGTTQRDLLGGGVDGIRFN